MAAPVLARVAAALLTNEDGRKTIGWVLALLLSPLILLVVFLCCFGDGASQHNNAVVSAAFYGAELSSQVPAEYRAHITEMQEAFSLLDSATVYVNQKAEGGSLDPVQVKAVFFALSFGDNAPTRAAADRFVDCFYKTETRTRMVTVVQEDGTEEQVEETYEVTVPLPMAEVYEKLSTWRGSVVTDEERSNAVDIYAIVMGSMGGDKIMENKSWTMADIFADEGITGTSAKKRAEFMRMMKWCKQGNVLTDDALRQEMGGGYDIVVANIVADVIMGLSGSVRGFLKPGGLFLCSGIIDDRAQEVREKLKTDGWDVIEQRQSEGWYSFLCR